MPDPRPDRGLIKPRNMLNERDHKQLKEKGISSETLLEQIEWFKQGFPPLRLDRPATAGDGIRQLEPGQLKKMASFYDDQSSQLRVEKFVPASGAASRMFKELFQWRELLMAGVETEALLSSSGSAREFFERLHEFAFWDELVLAMDKDDLDARHLLDNRNYLPLLDYLLFESGLEYAFLPKALIAFHRYSRELRTAMEEHLVEGAYYACDQKGNVLIHFTLSPEHIGRFRARLESVQEQYQKRFMVQFTIRHSVQKPSTDTIAVGPDNLPFREKDGSLLFRPGGHGALIENLNELEGDLIFIKNIDNVVPDRLKEQTILYKKVLGGLLLGLQQEVYRWLQRLDQGALPVEDYVRAVDFAVEELCIDSTVFPADPQPGSQVLRSRLDRPLRVCGMVKNQGEPGGGPFWVRDPETGASSLQIVELSQIDMDNALQSGLVEKATHFNPVDIVCSIRNYRGEVFDLNQFIDPQTGFISHKSKDGQELKALERPGLWNGAMAGWNTVFVEVPLITFNPVKTINDLLREEHR